MPTVSSATLSRPVETVMTRRIVQIIEAIPMAEVRNVAARYDYNAFPVVTPQGRLVGMITKGDLLRVACEAVEDPAVWTSPWTVQLDLTKIDGLVYEFACHEGNEISVTGTLRGARLVEKEGAVR